MRNKYIFEIVNVKKIRKGYQLRVDVYYKYKNYRMYEGYIFIDTTLSIEPIKEIFK